MQTTEHRVYQMSHENLILIKIKKCEYAMSDSKTISKLLR